MGRKYQSRHTSRPERVRLKTRKGQIEGARLKTMTTVGLTIRDNMTLHNCISAE